MFILFSAYLCNICLDFNEMDSGHVLQKSSLTNLILSYFVEKKKEGKSRDNSRSGTAAALSNKYDEWYNKNDNQCPYHQENLHQPKGKLAMS